MPLRLKDKTIFSSSGEKLKEINCPKRVEVKNLMLSGDAYQCAGCNSIIHNTDFMSEEQLEALLRDDPNVCLYINTLNPLFRIED